MNPEKFCIINFGRRLCSSFCISLFSMQCYYFDKPLISKQWYNVEYFPDFVVAVDFAPYPPTTVPVWFHPVSHYSPHPLVPAPRPTLSWIMSPLPLCLRVFFCVCILSIFFIPTTVFAPISAPGAFEIEIQHCQFALQLAPLLQSRIFGFSIYSSISSYFLVKTYFSSYTVSKILSLPYDV